MEEKTSGPPTIVERLLLVMLISLAANATGFLYLGVFSARPTWRTAA